MGELVEALTALCHWLAFGAGLAACSTLFVFAQGAERSIRRGLSVLLVHGWAFASFALFTTALLWPTRWHRCGHHPRVTLLLMAGAGLGAAWLVFGLPQLRRWTNR
ncbi:hypothetical protein DFR29_12422 [Tahibacter aquaticus]|uniref:Uncharacterized protein n=1 Tax=Tahibacter aquaticus TaxID=520092 RepID=A0A4V3DL48_9GAMM|nr:hypothetical protein DFR29_12422 [Tahibacter aquaticus]